MKGTCSYFQPPAVGKGDGDTTGAQDFGWFPHARQAFCMLQNLFSSKQWGACRQQCLTQMELWVDGWTLWMSEWDPLPGAPLLPPAKSPDNDNCCSDSFLLKCHIFYIRGEKLNLYLSFTSFKSIQLFLRAYFSQRYLCNSKWNRCPRSTHSWHRSKYL